MVWVRGDSGFYWAMGFLLGDWRSLAVVSQWVWVKSLPLGRLFMVNFVLSVGSTWAGSWMVCHELF